LQSFLIFWRSCRSFWAKMLTVAMMHDQVGPGPRPFDMALRNLSRSARQNPVPSPRQTRKICRTASLNLGWSYCSGIPRLLR
jgi:hypothetical protein